MKNKEQRFVTLLAEELPPGWTLATIGEMIDTDGVFTDGDWVVSKDQDPDGDVRLVQLADIGDGSWVNKSSRYLTYEKAIELGCTFLELGDVLIARMPDPLGRACIFPGDSKRCITAVDVCIVRTGNQDINHRWLMHTINSPAVRVVVESLQSGSTRKRISRKNLGRIEFPLPPSPEQRRIVAEIETQFTRLDAGVAALERAQANLRRYKASVLKAACEGRLVPTEAELARAEGRGYEPAGQLLARILAERRAKWEAEHPGKKYKEPASPDTENMLELPERWVWGKFEQLISSFRSGSSAVPQNEPTDFPILRSSSVRPLRLDCNDVRFVTEADSQRADNFLQEDDLLFTRLSGSLDYVGNCALVKGTESRGIQYPDRQFRAQLVEQGMGQYVEICFASSQLRKEITAQAKSTAGHQRISMGGIREQVLPLPPLAEQRRIVAEVERRLSVVAALEASVEAALARARRLRQAVLKRAFEGQLVPQDPDDEPASVLLERIRARRETGKKAGETNRKKKQLQQLELL